MRIMTAMSGGVDSSVAAALLREQGHEVLGVTLKLYTNEDIAAVGRTCCSLADVADARDVCARLGVPHYTWNYADAFRDEVMTPFARAYLAGRTPNPCLLCNAHMKFERMLRQALAVGCDALATGHYARIERRGDGRWLLLRGVDGGKDQSYMLYRCTQEQLARLRFPLGGLTKPRVRALAGTYGLDNAAKRDSQDICFVPDGDYAAFVERFTGEVPPPGDFVDEAGRVLGRHGGIHRYTVGQRRGLGVSAATPLYVQRLQPGEARVTLAPIEALGRREVCATAVNLIDGEGWRGARRVSAKIRYRHAEADAWAEYADGRLCVTFDAPQRGVAPGQALVLYDGETVVGGGEIV